MEDMVGLLSLDIDQVLLHLQVYIHLVEVEVHQILDDVYGHDDDDGGD
eukprot:CAMPEP_0201590372 /NCGR_PEP_ID=MMETSP0190_2-20130828/177026_1 /ASSEMBLY_ACC=CAM_ASM_000263 /TAXON_ID=37353 /ORGANISM="Rosalina sp." /LENGTH=47 /DNA_ID= /DNA_START= /DNA_END= /DNA_ORIENTATION=